ncbi:TAXI family TRAP transporter solute-binding subunit [Sneathiella sp.]|uniref:TAXI family TRAP transporter solute-binding subunit n=1 Tax=Sneathiella sp. TaxID=1964365 RepID=UPI003566CF77
MKMRNSLAAICAVFMVAGGAHAADRIAYGTSAIKSVHYTYAASAAGAINEKSGDKVDITVISTGGAVDNLKRIGQGQINMGLGTYEIVYQAYKGIGKFEGNAMPKLRALWVHTSALMAWVVREDSGIKTVAELAGKKFTPGQRGSGTEQLAIQMLEVINVKPEFYRASLADAVAAVKDNRSNGYVKAGGTGVLDGSTLELMAFTPIRLLNFTDDEVAKIKENLAYINFQKYKDNEVENFPAFTSPVQVVGQFALTDSLTDDQVIAILEGVVDNPGPQVAAFPSFGKLDVMQDSINLSTIPLHSGAVKFYRSRGLEIPERLIPPEMK